MFAVVSSNVLGFVWSIFTGYLKPGGLEGDSSEPPEAPDSYLLSYFCLFMECLELFLVTCWALFVF